MELFDELKVGSKVMSRESKSSNWEKLIVIRIEGDDITFDGIDGDIESNRSEVNEGIYFKRID